MNYRDQLNKMKKFANEQGFTYPTDYSYIQDSFKYSDLINPNGTKNEGTIRLLKEVNDFLDKKFGEKAIHVTEEDYNNRLKDLYDTLKEEGVTSQRGFLHVQRDKLLNIVDAMNEYRDTDYNTQFISTQRLNELIKQAGDITATLPKGDSLTFYEILEELIQGEKELSEYQ